MKTRAMKAMKAMKATQAMKSTIMFVCVCIYLPLVHVSSKNLQVAKPKEMKSMKAMKASQAWMLSRICGFIFLSQLACV